MRVFQRKTGHISETVKYKIKFTIIITIIYYYGE